MSTPWMGSPEHELREARKRIDNIYADLAQVREQRDALQIADEARAAINVGLREQVARYEKALAEIAASVEHDTFLGPGHAEMHQAGFQAIEALAGEKR